MSDTNVNFVGSGVTQMGRGGCRGLNAPVTIPVKPTVTTSPATPARLTATEPVVVSVRGQGSEIERIIVYASFASLSVVEVIFQGSAFTPNYNGQSSVTAVADGYDLTIRRNNGWPDSPEIFTHANTDKGGVNAA